jgi:hypothetical protein
MKANKAPEKIYVHEASALELTENLPYHIEYTRTDAFIKKACEFIETYPHLFMGVLRSEVIEDFKNYMKGE